MDRWLRDFAYRIEIRWWMLVGAGGLACVIAMVTVGFSCREGCHSEPGGEFEI